MNTTETPAACAVPGVVPDPADRTLEHFAAAHGIRRLFRIFNDIAQLRMPERILLYALIHGMRPRNVLEVGSAQGGSAFVISGAMDDNGFGRLVCIDPEFRLDDATQEAVRERVTWITGRTPEAFLAAAAAIAPARFELAFIDADHTFDAVVGDITGVMPLLANNAAILLHDSNHPEVRAAMREALNRHGNLLVDCGPFSVEPSVIKLNTGDEEVWSGLHLLRLCGGGVSTPDTGDSLIQRAWQTWVKYSRKRIAELEADAQRLCSGFDERGRQIAELQDALGRATTESQRLWSEMQPLLQGFEERGSYIRELEERLRQKEGGDAKGASEADSA